MATRNKRSFKNRNGSKNAWAAKQVTPKGVNTPYIGSHMNSSLGGVQVSNKSLEKFYGDKVKF